MNVTQRLFYFFSTALFLSSCASFENLTDDRTRAEDDEMYWNRKELFFDNTVVANNEGVEDDYYDPNYATRSNSISGGTNPRAAFNPISGWQLSYGLNSFSNYTNGYSYGLGFGSNNTFGNYGIGSNYGYNSYGNNSFGYGYNPYSSYNSFGGGYCYNPYGCGMGGLGWGVYGYGNGGNGYGANNNAGGFSGNGESSGVTHHHRRPASVGSGNSSSYNRGVLQKNLVRPIEESISAPQPVIPERHNSNSNYSNPTYSRPSSAPQYRTPSYSPPSRSTPTYSRPSTSGPTRPVTKPSQSSPQHNGPSRSAPTHNTPSTSPSNSPSRSAPNHSTPAPSSPSRSSSPGKRP